MINEADKPKVTKTVVVYSGRFQPFHKGHYASYQKLVSKFGADNVFIGTSNDTSGPKSPFNFKEKKKIATTMFGIPSNRFVQIKNPYKPVEILSKFDGQTTQYIAAVGEKDADRLRGNYFKPYKGKQGYGYDEIGYVYAAPAEPNPISGTDVRNNLGSGDEKKAKKFFLTAYPKFDKDIFDLITGKLINENLYRGYPSKEQVLDIEKKNKELRNKLDTDKDFVYDPIKEIIVNTITNEMFEDWLNEYLQEEPNPQLDKDIEYTNTKGQKAKIKARDALRLPKEHPAHVAAKKLVPDDQTPLSDTDKEKKEKGLPSDTEEKPKETDIKNQEQPEQEPQKLSGDEYQLDAEKSDKDKKEDKVKETLNNARKDLSSEENETIDKLNDPNSEERGFFGDLLNDIKDLPRDTWDAYKEAWDYIKSGVKHVIEHKKEMIGGSMKAVKSLATTGNVGSVKDKDGKSRHWSEFSSVGRGGGSEWEETEVDVLDSHGHPTGKTKTEKKPKVSEYATDEEKELFERSWNEDKKQTKAVKSLAVETAVIVGSIAVTGGIIGGVGAAAKGAGVAGIAKGAAGKAAYKLTGGHLGEYVVKDIIKHSAFEALGANTAGASSGGIALGATGIFEGIDENMNGKKFMSNLIKKTLEVMKTYKLSDEQLLRIIHKYKKEKPKQNAADLLKENLSETKQQSIQRFVEFATKRLKLKETPKVTLVGGREFAETKTSLGGFDPITKEIYVATEGRLTADILRTLAHEMVHRKQDELGLVRNPEKDGADGSPIENQAHAVAGILMREYGRVDKQIYQEDINVKVDKGDTILMGKFKNKKVDVKDIGKDSHGMPTINGRQATTFRTLDEMGNKDIHFKNVIELYRNQKFKKRINAYLFDNPNGNKADEVARSLRNMDYEEITKLEKELNLPNKYLQELNYNKSNNSKIKKVFDTFVKKYKSLSDINFETSKKTYTFIFNDKKDAEKFEKEFTSMGSNKMNLVRSAEYKDENPPVFIKVFGILDEVDNFLNELFGLYEVSTVTTSNTADIPDGAFIPKGKKRKLNTYKGEDWYKNGGYTQTDFPQADAIFGDEDADERTVKYTIDNLPRVSFTPTIFIKENKLETKKLLSEGGAYGHMSHPFDDMQLTFGELKDIIVKALNGELGVVREKTDGQALAISWKNGRLIAARNKGHLANAGANAMGIEDVASKFGGRGGLTDAYNFAMKDLTAAISGLSDKQRKKIFNEGKCFMNLEVIWPTSVNVIPYGQALLVFHNTTCYDENGVAVGADQGAASILAGMIKQVNADVQSKYTIQGPPVTEIPKSEDLSSKQGRYLSKLSKLQSEFKLGDSDTMALYHQKWWENYIDKNAPTKIDKLTKNALVRRWAFGDKSFRLNTISNAELQKWSMQNDKVDVVKKQKENMKRFEEIFLGVGADVLDFVSSVLTVHPDKAIRSMKAKLKQVAAQVKTSTDATKIAKFKSELQRLNSLGGIDRIVASEGLVFFYNGKTYKLTGTFAPLNQLLGIFYE